MARARLVARHLPSLNEKKRGKEIHRGSVRRALLSPPACANDAPVKTTATTHSIGAAGRGCGTVFFAIFAGFGVVFIVLFGKVLINDARPYLWRATDCTILESAVLDQPRRSDGGHAFGFTVRYTYQIDGTTHTATRFSTQDKRFDAVNDAERLVEKYRGDTRARCWVNPADPGEAVLERTPLWPAFFVLIPLVFVLIGAGGMVAVWRGKWTAASPVSESPTFGARPGLVRVFFAFIFIVGSAIFVPFFVLPALKIVAARDWPEMPCRVISSAVQSHSGDGTTYSIDIFYAYTIDGREHRSNRYGFFGGSTSGHAGKAAVVRRYPSGTQSVCYVNPADPTDAVLFRGAETGMWFSILPLLFVVVGAAGFFNASRMADATRRRDDAARSGN